jgi:hypothetical protein
VNACRDCQHLKLDCHDTRMHGGCGLDHWAGGASGFRQRAFRIETVVKAENRLIRARGRDCQDYTPMSPEALLGRAILVLQHWEVTNQQWGGYGHPLTTQWQPFLDLKAELERQDQAHGQDQDHGQDQ